MHTEQPKSQAATLLLTWIELIPYPIEEQILLFKRLKPS